MHEELVKQKSGFQSRIQSRDEEISRLRSQVALRHQLYFILSLTHYCQSTWMSVCTSVRFFEAKYLGN